ncbi:MAG: NAD-dependent epimerase/dehydratase family protein [Planctomycetota bacterium]|jgi:nucleoside-diphosphate-sugar epimerase
MKVAVTGATGFLGRYIVNHLLALGHDCRCWHRAQSDRGGFQENERSIEWVPGELDDVASHHSLVQGCDAVVHSALYRPGPGFRGAEGDVPTFAQRNIVATLQLIEAARAAGAGRFVFISTCAVHEKILDDRPLDEAHPLWMTTHYGAHKAAIEKFVHSYGLGDGYDICALRPTGIYGAAHPIGDSKWFELVQSVVRGEDISSDKGGKEVHAADVARATAILLTAEGVAGEAYNCYDRYVAHQEVAEIAKAHCGSSALIEKLNKGPKHQIETGKLRALGMEFGGKDLLVETVRELVEHAAPS